MNGQAKIDFEKDFILNYDFAENYLNVKLCHSVLEAFYKLPKSMQNAVKKDFFDSVGIYILPNRAFAFDEWNYEILGHITAGFNFKTRTEATEQAINKAVEIYNLK